MVALRAIDFTHQMVHQCIWLQDDSLQDIKWFCSAKTDLLVIGPLINDARQRLHGFEDEITPFQRQAKQVAHSLTKLNVI